MTVKAVLEDLAIDPPIIATTESISFVIDLVVPVPEEVKEEKEKVSPSFRE